MIRKDNKKSKGKRQKAKDFFIVQNNLIICDNLQWEYSPRISQISTDYLSWETDMQDNINIFRVNLCHLWGINLPRKYFVLTIFSIMLMEV